MPVLPLLCPHNVAVGTLMEWPLMDNWDDAAAADDATLPAQLAYPDRSLMITARAHVGLVLGSCYMRSSVFLAASL